MHCFGLTADFRPVMLNPKRVNRECKTMHLYSLNKISISDGSEAFYRDRKRFESNISSLIYTISFSEKDMTLKVDMFPSLRVDIFPQQKDSCQQ